MSDILFDNENMEVIRKRIAETEADIDALNEELQNKVDEKAEITAKYESVKADYDDYKYKYTRQSTNGNYLLIVSGIVFVVIAYLALTDKIVDFMMIPSGAIFAVAIVLKFINFLKFRTMTPKMDAKEAEYTKVKATYDEFMAEYTGTEVALEKKQYQWELVENDMIEARKDAWVAQQRAAAKEETVREEIPAEIDGTVNPA
jgi:chromosome segregation ATPase